MTSKMAQRAPVTAMRVGDHLVTHVAQNGRVVRSTVVRSMVWDRQRTHVVVNQTMQFDCAGFFETFDKADIAPDAATGAPPVAGPLAALTAAIEARLARWAAEQ